MADKTATISEDSEASFSVKLDNKDPDSDFNSSVLEILVDTCLYMPDMFTIVLHDDDATFVDDTTNLDLGKSVEILVGDQSLMKGEITGIEPNFAESGIRTLLVRGYDQSHRLHRGRKTRTFTEQTDKSIIETIAKEAGLKTEIETISPTITHSYLIQNNQTNMEFLLMRAELLGYQVYAKDGTLYFKKATSDHGDGPALEWRTNLLEFQPRLTAAHQTDKAVVMGWDPHTKKSIKSEVTPDKTLNQGGVSETGGDKTKSAFGESAEAVVVNQPVFTVDEAKAIATGVSSHATSRFIQAEGYGYGDPLLKAGTKVEISDVGTRFSGTYFITAATHTFKAGVYRTSFSVSGRRPNTIVDLLQASNDQNQQWGKVPGLVTGLVSNNKDADELGRVKVKFPWLLDTKGVEIDSHWARLSAPMAGQNQKGLYYIPEVNDEVLVGFEHGDMRYPYVLGALWNRQDKPPEKSSKVVNQGKTNQWIIRSRSGHIVILDDTQGSEKITIRDKTESNEIIIDSKKNNIEITAKNELLLKAKSISLEADDDIKLTSKNLIVDSKQKAQITANQTIDLKANQTLSMTASVKAELTGNTGVQIKSGAASVDLKGGPVDIKGIPIKLN